MRLIRGKIGCKRRFKEEICLTIGNFDGVHIGHQRLINATKDSKYKSMVMTFYPHPSTVVKPNTDYKFISPLSKKIELIRSLGVDYLFLIDFDIHGASMGYLAFMKWLKSLNVKKIICGADYRFGHFAVGTIDDLRKNFIVEVLDDVIYDNTRVSSTEIKKALSEGEIEKANTFLGHPYSIEGLVVHGSQIGIQLGFPTANIDIFGNIVPKMGVYAVKVYFNKKMYYGMANIGHNPTVNYQLNARLEVHLFNFQGDLYDSLVNVVFLKYWRGEQKFENMDELINRLNLDYQEIKNWTENI